MDKNIFQPKIVVIGGGTGSFTILKGIKNYTPNVTALVNMADDGGSTGVLRDELGVLPPGDVRQCLVALSDTQRVRDLFSYRFNEGSLKGHSFGNLFLSAVEKMTNSFEEAVDVASEVLRITGDVVPVTLEKTNLCAKLPNGKVLEGEYKIGHADFNNAQPEIYLKPAVSLNPKAKKVLIEADLVVIAPGNLYGSLAPALVVDGMKQALSKTKAKIVCVTNLVTKPGQTDGFSVSEHIEQINRLVGLKNVLDYVIFNTDEPTEKTYDKYLKEGELVLGFDLDKLEAASYAAIGLPLIDKTPVVQFSSQDKIAHARSLIRHDSDRVAREIMKISFS